jgi:hypothetical protein
MPYKHQVQAILLALTLSILLGTARAALIEHNLVVEPNFVHESDLNSISSRRSFMRIPLPSLTLSPGDLLRVTVELPGSKYLKLGPTPSDGFQGYGAELHLSHGTSGGSSADGNGASETVRIFDAQSQIVLEQTRPSSYAADFVAKQIHESYTQAWHEINYGEPTDTTFRKWFLEMQIPTIINTFYGSFPNPTTTFAVNEVYLEFNVFRFGPVPITPVAVYVVPEPALIISLAVMGFAAMLCRQSFSF